MPQRRRTATIEAPTSARALVPARLADAIRSAYRGTFTQSEVAERIGVAQNTVSRWSTGDVVPSLEDIARLEQVCGLVRGSILRKAGLVDDVSGVEDLIAVDPRLDDQRRELLLSAYRAAVQQSRR